MIKDILRRCIFRPYHKGKGPVFTLTTWDLHRYDHMGKWMIGYRLSMDGKTLFEGEDFSCAPRHCIDSDEAVASLMGFLTLRPGAIDDGYFENYTQEQLDYCDTHAETLAYTVANRYGEL